MKRGYAVKKYTDILIREHRFSENRIARSRDHGEQIRELEALQRDLAERIRKIEHGAEHGNSLRTA